MMEWGVLYLSTVLLVCKTDLYRLLTVVVVFTLLLPLKIWRLGKKIVVFAGKISTQTRNENIMGKVIRVVYDNKMLNNVCFLVGLS